MTNAVKIVRYFPANRCGHIHYGGINVKRIADKMIIGIIVCLTVPVFFYTKARAQTESSASQVIIGRKEEPPEVKGPVQRIESKQIRFRNGVFKRSEKIISWDQTAYNRQGRSVETVSFKSDGKPDGKEVKSYDDRGNLTERIGYDSGNIVTVKVNYKYDAHGRKIEELYYDHGYAHIACGDHYKTVYKYDDRKRTAETLNYDGQNQLVLRRLETYNLDGAVSEMVCENPARGYAICPAGKRVYKYDSRGNQIEQAGYNISGKYTGGIFRKYNDQGKEIEWEMPGIIRVVSFYDPNGVKIESATYSRSGRISTKTKYDSRGREIMRTGLRPDGVLEKDYYVREFDVYGNLLKETWWRKEIPSGNSAPSSEWLKEEKDMGTMIEVIEHKISYYK
jgi:hypothetical protein